MLCVICQEKFDHNAHVPIIGTCGHTVCKTCASHVMTGLRPRIDCPLCKKQNPFQQQLRNYQLMEILDDFHRMRNLVDTHQLRGKKFLICRNCWSPVEDEKSRICVSCCVADGFIERKTEDNSVEIVDVDKVKESVLCAGCCLEGIHEGHDSRLLPPILSEFSSPPKDDGSSEDETQSMDETCSEMEVPLSWKLRRQRNTEFWNMVICICACFGLACILVMISVDHVSA